jgi:hypothetical protein
MFSIIAWQWLEQAMMTTTQQQENRRGNQNSTSVPSLHPSIIHVPRWLFLRCRVCGLFSPSLLQDQRAPSQEGQAHPWLHSLSSTLFASLRLPCHAHPTGKDGLAIGKATYSIIHGQDAAAGESLFWDVADACVVRWGTKWLPCLAPPRLLSLGGLTRCTVVVYCWVVL